MHIDLQELLMEYCDANPEAVQKKDLDDCSLSITQIRDKLYRLGTILYEDLENQICVASVRAGFADMNQAVVVIQLQESRLLLVGYAKEGCIKQNICEEAFQKIQNVVDGKTTKDASRFPKIMTIAFVVVGLMAFISIRGYVVNRADPDIIDEALQSLPVESGSMETLGSTEVTEATEDPAFVEEVMLTVEATKKYNNAVKQFNLRVEEYNNAVSQVCIDNVKGLPTKLEQLSLESEAYEDNVNIVLGDYNNEKIAADTAQVHEMCLQVGMLIKVIQQINAPDGDWVCEKLNNIEGVTGCQQVTEALNPDGLLGKEGGYTACIYFTHSSVDQKDIPGDSIVAKGTDAGGAVEIYPSLADTQARVEYLGGFDNTILYTGSYAILGTMVIRTSYKLSDEQQFLLTDAITMALTTVENTAE